MNLVHIRSFAVAFLAFPSLLMASGYEFEGIGTRQVSRAGAATADVDDWTAIYWNPAAMVAITENTRGEMGLEIFGGEARAKDSNSLSTLPGIGTSLGFQKDELNSPFILGAGGIIIPVSEKWAMGGGFYTPLLQGLDFSDASPTTGATLSYEASAGILVGNLSTAYELSPVWSFGTGINLLYGKIKSQTHLISAAGTLDASTDGDGTGFEGVFSTLARLNSKWKVGAIYRTGGDVDIKGDSNAHSDLVFPFPLTISEASESEFSLRHPPTASVGLAYKPAEKTTWTFDVARTFWGRFSSEIQYDQQGILQSNLPNTFDWRNTWKLKTGVKHGLSENTSLFTGYSYDQPAVDPGSIDFSTTVDVPMHRVAVGTARRWSERFETSIGTIIGRGTRNEGGVRYKLTGWQLMLETRYTFS